MIWNFFQKQNQLLKVCFQLDPLGTAKSISMNLDFNY